MALLTRRADRRISGAIMVDGEMLCFDATDFDLEAGAKAVVIGASGRIFVDTVVADHPTEMRKRGKTRSALINFVSGAYLPGTPERLHVRVLGRYIPHTQEQRLGARIDRVKGKVRATRELEGAL